MFGNGFAHLRPPITMPGRHKVYAVAIGRCTGLFQSWEDAKKQVHGFPGGRVRRFPSNGAARDWLSTHGVSCESAVAPRSDRSSRATLRASVASGDPQAPRSHANGVKALSRDQLAVSVDEACEFVRQQDSSKVWTLHCDGGSRGNPGTAGAGGVIKLNDSSEHLCTYGYFLGDSATNNRAEYVGLIEGLHWAKLLGIESLTVYMDSKLCVEQVNGRWRVKNAGLAPLWRQACEAMESFPQGPQLLHVARAFNAEADAAANLAMDMRAHFYKVIDEQEVTFYSAVNGKRRRHDEAADSEQRPAKR